MKFAKLVFGGQFTFEPFAFSYTKLYFSSFEQKHIHLPFVYWVADWLTHSSVRIMLLALSWLPHPLVSQEMMHIKGCVSHFAVPTLWVRSSGKGFESLRPLQGRHEGLHDSRFWARRVASPHLKSNLRHFKSSELKNKNRWWI